MGGFSVTLFCSETHSACRQRACEGERERDGRKKSQLHVSLLRLFHHKVLSSLYCSRIINPVAPSNCRALSLCFCHTVFVFSFSLLPPSEGELKLGRRSELLLIVPVGFDKASSNINSDVKGGLDICKQSNKLPFSPPLCFHLECLESARHRLWWRNMFRWQPQSLERLNLSPPDCKGP